MTRARTGQNDLATAFAERDHVFCEFCGVEVHQDVPEASLVRATIDHRRPRARGGTHRRSNIAITCRLCNSRKRWLTEAEFRSVMHDPAALDALLAATSLEVAS